MWLKLCLLLVYILLLFILTRILEAISWCESGYSGVLSRQFLDPMVLSVARLKALLEQRGVSYEGVVDKTELAGLVEASGQVSTEEAEMTQVENMSSSETNFTSGAHFIEQVEDAKDSVWLVQVVSNSGKFRVLSGTRWKAIKEKASKFGVRTGFLDCSLDVRYCSQKGWRSPFLLLALPSQFEKKASVAMYNYSGSVKETAVFRWIRDKLDERVQRIEDPALFHQKWQDFSSSALEPEIRTVLFTKSTSAPLFYSALSVKFPGRVKFGLVSLQSTNEQKTFWHELLKKEKISNFPAYVTYFVEKNYTYGLWPGELYTFSSMEQFFRFLYPCLNDIFITSFCVANILSWFELFISNCSILKRFSKFIWCMFKYNIAVIMLWLPIIGIFQMPYLDRIPLIALKMTRIFSTSSLGTILRGDYTFYLNHPLYIFVSFGLYLALITFLCKKYRQAEQDESNWFNFNLRTHTHLRPNDFFEPMRRGYDLLGGLDVFGSHLSQPSLWLHPSISSAYIKHLPTWQYCPVPLTTRAAENSRKVEQAMNSTSKLNSSNIHISGAPSNYPEVEYPSGCRSDKNNGLGKSLHSFLEAEPDKTVSCSSVETISCDISMQPFHTSSHSHKSSEPTNRPINLPSSDAVNSTTLTNPTAEVSSIPHCHNNHRKTSLDKLQTSCLAHDKFQSSRSETPGRNRKVSDNNSTETYNTYPSQPEAAGSSAGKNQAPCTALSNGNGFPVGYIDSHHCVICLDEYAPFAMLCGLPCGHVFHESCIISWFNREKHFCPMCRWPSYKRHPPPVQRLPVT